jgi:non-ribosomal peptide synthetase component F
VAALAEAFRAELEALVAHCLQPDVGGASPADFPLATLSQAELDAFGVPARELEDVYPLSPLQQGLMFHALYHQDSAAYVNQLSVEVSGLDVERLRGAWQAVIARHEALRTGFVQVSGEPGLVQVVRRSAPMNMRELSAAEVPSSPAALADWAEQERTQAFDIARPPLQRVLLVPLGTGRHQLIWTHHHIILDGWSSARLLEEVLRLYRGETLAPKAGRYVRYIEWLRSRDSAASERFWRQELLALEQPTSLAGVLPKGTRASGHAQLRAQWPLEQSEALQRFARRERITQSTLVQGAWILLLQRYTAQRHVAVGVTVAGRPAGLPGVEEMLGLFINTVPLIEGPAPAQDLCEWLRALSAHNVALREQEHTPLPDIQRWAGRAGQALFDTLIVFENYPMDRALRERGGAELRFGAVETVERTNYALTLEVNASHGLTVTYKYATEHFEQAQIEALHRQLQHLLEEMARTTSRRPLAQLSLLDAAERAAQKGWNDTAREQGPEQYVHQLIEEQAALEPDAVALVCEDAILSYGELNARANQLARWLRSAGVGPDVAVGVCLERSVELVIALLAVLKAGGAYVPLDPSYPRERLAYMLQDSGVRCLLSRTALLERFPQDLLSWCADRDSAQLESFARDNLSMVSRPGHLCYCIYTSGSTGRPKGVQLEHWGFTNYVRWAQRAYRMEELDGSAVHSSIGFDLTVTSLWVPLCTGKRVELTRDDHEPLAALANTLERGAPIGLLKLTPSHALALAEVLNRPLPGLRAWIVGGEALSWDCVEALNRIAPNARVVNEYGPTEAVVGCCVHEPDAVWSRRRSARPSTTPSCTWWTRRSSGCPRVLLASCALAVSRWRAATERGPG